MNESLVLAACGFALLLSLAPLQTAQRPSFEVASIKATTDLGAQRGGGFMPGGGS